ncbi:hypothetical protein [Candidatus Poriferisodalis sp.]|uniref:hypothetical protein n=1 Tax=Candidatus Poriferisodalis sp. TaxID=3101277 RepID=UPI003B519BA1
MKRFHAVAGFTVMVALGVACSSGQTEIVVAGAGPDTSGSAPEADVESADVRSDESDTITLEGTLIEGAASMPLRELVQRVLGSDPDLPWLLFDPDAPLTHEACDPEPPPSTPSNGERVVTRAEAFVHDACYMAADFDIPPWQALIQLDQQSRAGAFTSRWRTEYPDEFDVALNLTVRWNSAVPPEVLAEAQASGLPFRFEQSTSVTAAEIQRAAEQIWETLRGFGIRNVDYGGYVLTRTVEARIGQAFVDGVPIDREAVEAALPRRPGITYEIEWLLDPDEISPPVVDRFVVAFVQMSTDNLNRGTLRIGDECIWVEHGDGPTQRTLVFAHSERLSFDASIPAVVNGEHVMRDGDEIEFGGSADGHINTVGDDFLTLPHSTCPPMWHIAVGPSPYTGW